MKNIPKGIQSGAWLTEDRIRVYSLLMLGIEIAFGVGWIAISDGLIDPNGKPIGTDFSSFYAAASLALEGRALDVYDFVAHLSRQQTIFGASTGNYAFAYPPIFLLMIMPLGALSYPIALIVWQLGTLLGYLAMIGAIMRPMFAENAEVRRLWLLVALAFPAVFINLGHGQNGLLSASLLGGAVVTCRTRPILAGVLFGLLAYKPQFALIIPVALIAAGLWRCMAAAAVTAVLLGLASTLAFGVEIWPAFIATSKFAQSALLEHGAVGYEKLQTVFAAARQWGGSVTTAYVLQTLASLVAIAAVARVWRRHSDDNASSALLIIASLIASPHVLDYDLVILAPAIALMARLGIQNGFRPYELTALAAVWAAPLLARSIAKISTLPIGLLSLAMFFAVTLLRCNSNSESKNPSNWLKSGLVDVYRGRDPR